MLLPNYLILNKAMTVVEAQKALDQYGITVGDYGHFAVFNYSQIDSPKFVPLVEEARGLILEVGSWRVLSRAFDRFYNLDEDPNSEQFPIEKATIYEKIDGSLISIWKNGKIFNASTRKMGYAEGETPCGLPFRSLIVRALGGPVANFFDPDLIYAYFGPDATLVCELVSPESRVVKPYKETLLYLLTVRYFDGREASADMCDQYAQAVGLPRPKRYTFDSFEAIQENLKTLPAMDEGYVATVHMGDDRYWRLKIKNPAYLAIAHLHANGAISTKRIAQLVMSGNSAEYLSYFPEDSEIFKPWQVALYRFEEEVHRIWEENRHLESQKDFALKVKDLGCAGILFKMRKGLQFEECIESTQPEQLEALLRRYKNA